MEQSRAESLIETYKDGMLDKDDKNSFQRGFQLCLIDFGYKIMEKWNSTQEAVNGFFFYVKRVVLRGEE